MDEWFSSLNLYGISTLFVYGGNSQAYEQAKVWLHQNENRQLVFLEDDYETFENLKAINDPQVYLHFIKNNKIEGLPFHLLFHPFNFSCIQKDKEKGERLHNTLSYLKYFFLEQQLEYIAHGEGYFRNFYPNLINLPNSKFGNKLFGAFKGIPAIICGAGPSLEKQLPLLASIKDRALLFAGGSTLNALQGLLPHFGVTIDPNVSQYSRLAMAHAYEVPFFYRGRVFHDVLSLIHGERLYISGAEGYPLIKKIEEDLGIRGEDILEGGNVVNFSLAIAYALGCSPLILVGTDLSYPESKSYAPGIVSDPLLAPGHLPETRSIHEALIEKKDIYGNPVLTLWKWVAASQWISHFAQQAEVVNCTEGGIGMDGVPNIPLQEMIEKSFHQNYDFPALIHSAIQKSAFPSDLTSEKIKSYLKNFSDELKALLALSLDELLIHPIYDHLLAPFHQAFLEFYGEDNLLLRDFLGKVLASQIRLIEGSLILEPESRPSDQLQGLSLYKDENGRREFYYPSGALYSIQQEEKWEFFYLDGTLKTILEFKNGRLDGTVQLNYPNGKLKRSISYLQGKRNGMELSFYPDGGLATAINFSGDQPQGLARAWHTNRQLGKEILFDEEGKVSSIHLWNSDGAPLKGSLLKQKDYLEEISKQSNVLNTLFEQVESVLPSEELKDVLKETEKLKKFQEEISILTKEAADATKEPLWKNPETHRLLKQQLEESSKKMAKDVEAFQAALKKVENLLKKPQDHES